MKLMIEKLRAAEKIVAFKATRPASKVDTTIVAAFIANNKVSIDAQRIADSDHRVYIGWNYQRRCITPAAEESRCTRPDARNTRRHWRGFELLGSALKRRRPWFQFVGTGASPNHQSQT